MTKYKEYLRAKGIKLECDYESLPCGYIEAVATEATDNCVAAVVYSNCAGAEYAVFNRYGMCGYFDAAGYKAYVIGARCNPEYIAFLLDMGYTNSERAIAVMRYVYENDEKTRVAFNHMKAGIMDKEVFRKWHFNHCLEYVGVL